MTPPIHNPAELGQAIRQRRSELGLTQSQLADAANTSLRFISELERGKLRAEIAGVFRVLTALGIRIDLTWR